MTRGFLYKKGEVQGVKYHKEGNYFNHINDKHMLKKIVFSLAEVVSDLGILCWYRGNPVFYFSFMMLCQHNPLCKRTFKFCFKKRGQTELKQFLVETQLNVDLTVMAQCQSATAEMFLKKVLQPSFASIILIQGRRVKQWDREVFIKEKITGSCHGITITSKSRYPCQTMCLLILLLDYILP